MLLGGSSTVIQSPGTMSFSSSFKYRFMILSSFHSEHPKMTSIFLLESVIRYQVVIRASFQIVTQHETGVMIWCQIHMYMCRSVEQNIP
jgi:hypothetical protein